MGKNFGNVVLGLLVGLTYLTSRKLFNQSPKNSLIATAILSGIVYGYGKWLNKDENEFSANENNKSKQSVK